MVDQWFQSILSFLPQNLTALNSIGSKIRILREIREYSQEYVSAQLGISQRAYSKIERGDTDLSFNKLEALAEIFQVKTVHLISLDIFPWDSEEDARLEANEHRMLQVYVDQIKYLQEETRFLRQQIELLSELLSQKMGTN